MGTHHSARRTVIGHDRVIEQVSISTVARSLVASVISHYPACAKLSGHSSSGVLSWLLYYDILLPSLSKSLRTYEANYAKRIPVYSFCKIKRSEMP